MEVKIFKELKSSPIWFLKDGVFIPRDTLLYRLSDDLRYEVDSWSKEWDSIHLMLDHRSELPGDFFTTEEEDDTLRSLESSRIHLVRMIIQERPDWVVHN